MNLYLLYGIRKLKQQHQNEKVIGSVEQPLHCCFSYNILSLFNIDLFLSVIELP